jgi:hypothetical protein
MTEVVRKPLRRRYHKTRYDRDAFLSQTEHRRGHAERRHHVAAMVEYRRAHTP